MIVRATTCAVVLILASAALLLQPQAAVAQQEPVDLSGSWVPYPNDNPLEVDEGPFTDDWTGMPLSAAGRALAQSYSASMYAEPERVCQLYGQWKYMTAPFPIRIWPVVGKSTDQIQAWRLQKTEDQGGMTIWMDGRAPPSKYLHFPRGAFTTGHWKGDTLIANTTHLKMAPARNNGGFYSDQATLTSTFIPHGDLLVVVFILHDPVYFTQPYVYSRAFSRSARPASTAWPPCIVNYEGTAEGDVPFFLPGKDPLLDQMMQLFHVPVYASEGGADTMYPAYRDRLKAQYLKLYPTFPKKCTQYCTNFRFMQAVGNLPQPPAKPARGKAKSAR
ncbi:MAG: hypothetical protein ACREU2_14125 [Steroidobacteraceae bacterium]